MRPVPGNAIGSTPFEDLNGFLGRFALSLLRLAAKRAFGGPGLERLAAMPAEAGLGGIAGPETRLDVRNTVVTPAVGPSRTAHRLAGGQDVLEDLGGLAVAHREVGRQRA